MIYMTGYVMCVCTIIRRTWLQVNLNYQDQLEQERADSRNAVEEYVYGMRDKLTELGEFITDEDKAAFGDLLSRTEDWLYDEGEEQPKKVYVAKLVELRKCGDPVIQREKEFLEKPAAFSELGSMIIHFEKFIENYTQGVCTCIYSGVRKCPELWGGLISGMGFISRTYYLWVCSVLVAVYLYV